MKCLKLAHNPAGTKVSDHGIVLSQYWENYWPQFFGDKDRPDADGSAPSEIVARFLRHDRRRLGLQISTFRIAFCQDLTSGGKGK
jgi:hypothetical protein